MRMKTSRTYWGWAIEVTTGQQADGSWRGTARIEPAGGAAAATAAGATRLATPSFTTEAEARSAAEAQARGWVDVARVNVGKP